MWLVQDKKSEQVYADNKSMLDSKRSLQLQVDTLVNTANSLLSH